MQHGKNDGKEWEDACSNLRLALLLGHSKKRWYVSFSPHPLDIMHTCFSVLFIWSDLLCHCAQNPSCCDGKGPQGPLWFLLSPSRDANSLLHAIFALCSESLAVGKISTGLVVLQAGPRIPVPYYSLASL